MKTDDATTTLKNAGSGQAGADPKQTLELLDQLAASPDGTA
jgi:hypothetical protein